MNTFTNTTVAIFAGGKSTRFGSPKVNAKIDGVEFGEIIARVIRDAGFSKIYMIGGDSLDAKRWGMSFVPDLYVDSGPLGALITAMRACETEQLMTLPCDVPYIKAETSKALSELSNDFDVRVATTDSPQWLCSTWRSSLIDFLVHQFEMGARAIHEVAEKLKVEFVEIPIDVLTNVNEKSQLKSHTESF